MPRENPIEILSRTQEIRIRAVFLGQRIDLRALANVERIALSPLTVRAGEHGLAMLFRFGAVVLFDVKPLEEAAFLRQLAPLVGGPFDEPETEEVKARIDPGADEHVSEEGQLLLHEPTLARLHVVASVLAKSVVLAHYEELIEKQFDRVEPLTRLLQRKGRVGSQSRVLLKEIGDVLMIQQQMVGRVEIVEKPELLWERPDLERLHERLQEEYELAERDAVLDRKLDLVSRSAETSVRLLQDKRSIRVEWYIVILILLEILLYSYEIFIRG